MPFRLNALVTFHCDILYRAVKWKGSTLVWRGGGVWPSLERMQSLAFGIVRYVRRIGICSLTPARAESRLKLFRLCCRVLKKCYGYYQVSSLV